MVLPLNGFCLASFNYRCSTVLELNLITAYLFFSFFLQFKNWFSPLRKFVKTVLLNRLYPYLVTSFSDEVVESYRVSAFSLISVQY